MLMLLMTLTNGLIRIKSKGKVKCGQKTCRFVQPPDGEKSIIPRILKKLLKAKDTRVKIKTTEDPNFKKKVYDGLQLAYKLIPTPCMDKLVLLLGLFT